MKDKLLKILKSKYMYGIGYILFNWFIMFIGALYYYNHGITFESVGGFILYSWLSNVISFCTYIMEVYDKIYE